MSKFKYYIFNKPYNVLSQFTRELPQHITLQDFIQVEKDVYPVGRLDKDSEGILLLTNDNQFKSNILDPNSKSIKTYWAQVEGEVSIEALDKLRKGVNIKLKSGIYKTKPAKAYHIRPTVPDRNPPIRKRINIPTSWIEISITEGKNRQVRKMCAAVGFPCLRLIRVGIKTLKSDKLLSGEFRILTSEEVAQLKS